jgi:hypothetical protein
MKPSFEHLSKYRIRTGPLGSDNSAGCQGAFEIPFKNNTIILQIIASNGIDGEFKTGWEHVSLKAKVKGSSHWRCPTWEEMSYIKDLFWNDNETVIQFHPSKSSYINTHPAVLHLWKPFGIEIPLPPTILV